MPQPSKSQNAAILVKLTALETLLTTAVGILEDIEENTRPASS
jgi:hypothetical protein